MRLATALRCAILLTLAGLNFGASLESQCRQTYRIPWWTLNEGGTTEGLEYGPYSVRAVVGQAVAGDCQGGPFTLRTGFIAPWPYLKPGVEERTGNLAGLESRLFPNVPNPFGRTTTIRYQVGHRAGEEHVDVTLKVYDVSGRLVTTLMKGSIKPGVHEVTWVGTDRFGRDVGPGIYFCRFRAGGFAETRKLIRMR